MDMFNHSALWFMLLTKWIITGSLAQVSIITDPQNQAVLQSQSATFQCRVQQDNILDNSGYIAWAECITIAWGLCLSISRDGIIIYSGLGDPIRGARYSIISNPAQKQFDLTIGGMTGVLLEDGGQYKCESRNDDNTRRFAELIVLDADPVCTRNTTRPNEALPGEYVKMTCTVTYKGRWAPVMDFLRNGADITAVDESSGNIVTYSYTLVVQPSNHGDVYTSRTYFNTPTDVGINEAANRPNYENNFSFDPLIVGPTTTTTTHASSEPTIATTTFQAGSPPCDSDSNSLLIAVGMLAAVLVISLIANVMLVFYIRGRVRLPTKLKTTQTNSSSQSQQSLSPTYLDMNGRQPVAPSEHTNIHRSGDPDQNRSPYDPVQYAAPYQTIGHDAAGQQQVSSAYLEMSERQPVAPSVYTDMHRQYPGMQDQNTSSYDPVHYAGPYETIA